MNTRESRVLRQMRGIDMSSFVPADFSQGIVKAISGREAKE